MMYALINPDNEYVTNHDFNQDEIPNTKPGWKWIPMEADPRPPYNPELQVVEEHQVVEETRVYRYWTIRDKEPYELDADKIQKINGIDPAVLTALLDIYNQVNTPITMEEYKLHLKSII